MILLKLKFRENHQPKGWNVELSVEQLEVETEGFLLSLPLELESSLRQWQSAYYQIKSVRACIAPKPGIRLIPKSVANYYNPEDAIAVKKRLNQWLNSGDLRWKPILNKLVEIAQQLKQIDEETSVIIETEDTLLQHLPWEEWDIFQKYYPQAGIALSIPKNLNKIIINSLPKSKEIRILLVIGRSNNIIREDLEFIEDLKENGASVVCLMQPSFKELHEALRDKIGFHIFIFTGHSGKKDDESIGWIELNEKDSFSIEQLIEGLKKTIEKGLQLVIFNGCDGLELAQQLSQLNLPQSIVMQEPLPNLAAIEFLKYFFRNFAQNKSIFTAVHTARKYLEYFQFDDFHQTCYPGANRLPTIYLSPEIDIFSWDEMTDEKTFNSIIFKKRENLKYRQSQIINIRNLWNLFYVIVAFLVLGSALLYVYETPFTESTEDEVIETKQNDFDSINLPKGSWRYGGSTSWVPIREKFEEAIKNTHPQFKLKYTDSSVDAPGSGTGIKMLLNNELDFSLSSRSLTNSERQKAKEQGFRLQQIPVVIDGIALAVNPSLNISGLTVAQLRDIYTGKIRNWENFGGPDLPITVYSRHPKESGTVEFFKHKILRDESFGDNVKFVSFTTRALKKVGVEPGAIYYASASEVIPQCSVKSLAIGERSDQLITPYKRPFIPLSQCPRPRNQVNLQAFQTHRYPISRPLYIITKINEDIKSKTIKDQNKHEAAKAYAKLFATNQGHTLIQEAEFIPILNAKNK
ncbi:substrate-binding domain-containing protein [Mastigocoleus testarum]|uniref:Phosphate ABC transporter substrate-binding protein n=1 Tax=Mastigocoleus testarum BC008 TaxID=371196 RepID=A0A0V7ZCP4_9CYAN|nr:substrate-binding domain-containing protein [Mastigocoleus testarum]KST62292.1 hypothetical protein BC008_08970 [Mastigocoleus testarum BC008]KST64111.1 hypothetical protein BC008_15815 [Mastigocoleus testarum BC008]